MASILKLRRGNRIQNNAFTGAEGELSYDSTAKKIRVHDGITLGGKILASEIVSVKDFGAVGDGVADDTNAITAAVTYAASGRINLFSGTSRANGIQLDGTSVLGIGPASILKANSTTEILKLGYINSPGQWTKRSIQDITIDGNAKASDGVKFSSIMGSTEVSGRWVIDKVTFANCNRGIYKPTGNIGNAYRDLNFTGNNYGFYAVGQTSPAMHAGSDVFDNCQFDSNSLAAIYIDSTVSGTGGTQITSNTIIEYNPGFGIFVKNYSSSFTPLVMDGVWFEGNATEASVVINSVSYTPVDIYLEDTIQAELKNGIVPKIQLVNSSLVIDSCNFNYDTSQFTIDSTSVCYAQNAYVDGGLFPIEMRTISRVIRALGNFSMRCYAPKRAIKSHSQTNFLQSITYANADIYTFTGTSSVHAATKADGLIFDSCAELAVPASYTLLQPGVTITSGKWYLFTIDLKYVSGTLADLQINFSNTFTIANDFATLLVAGKWKTITGMGLAGSGGNTQLRLINGSVGTQTIRLSALQILEFDTEYDMLSYYNSGTYLMPNTLPRVIYSTVSPTTGTWVVGDRCYNTVAVAGQPKSWVCTVAGTPGTWVSEGNL